MDKPILSPEPSHSPTLVIKIGGSVLSSQDTTLQDLVVLQQQGTIPVVIHGGGQVILATVDGVPIGIATLRFKYLSGLYREGSSSLYVNRGIGYLGIPIRINCPPEISRFKLIRANSADNGLLPS